jgi:hypothetical protein
MTGSVRAQAKTMAEKWFIAFFYTHIGNSSTSKLRKTSGNVRKSAENFSIICSGPSSNPPRHHAHPHPQKTFQFGWQGRRAVPTLIAYLTTKLARHNAGNQILEPSRLPIQPISARQVVVESPFRPRLSSCSVSPIIDTPAGVRRHPALQSFVHHFKFLPVIRRMSGIFYSRFGAETLISIS